MSGLLPLVRALVGCEHDDRADAGELENGEHVRTCMDCGSVRRGNDGAWIEPGLVTRLRNLLLMEHKLKPWGTIHGLAAGPAAEVMVRTSEERWKREDAEAERRAARAQLRSTHEELQMVLGVPTALFNTRPGQEESVRRARHAAEAEFAEACDRYAKVHGSQRR